MKAEEIQSIYALIDWMLRLRPELEAELDKQIVLLEQEQHMPHITSMERRGIEIGRAEGRLEGRQVGIAEGRLDLLTRMVQRRCGPLSRAMTKRLQSLSSEEIERLSDDIFDIESLSQLREWFRQRSASE